MNPQKTIDVAILAHEQVCLLVQGVFLNALWMFLVLGWIVAARKNPKGAFGGGLPSKGHLGLAIAVWAGSFGIALAEFDPSTWFLAFAIANGAMLSMLNPAFALSFALSMMLMRPWEMMRANAVILEIPRFSMSFSIAWSLLYFVTIDRFTLRLNRTVLILLAFAAWMFASTTVIPDAGPARLLFSEMMVRAVIIFLLIHHLVRDSFSMWSLRTTLTTILTGIGMLSIMLYFEGYRETGRLLAFGIFKNTNDIAAVMVLLFCLGLAPWVAKGRGSIERLISFIPIGTSLLSIALSQSRGALVSIGAVGAVHAFTKIQRKGLAVLAIIVIVGSGYVATSAFKRDAGDLEASSESRKSFWISGINMAVYNPIFGVGFTRFPHNFERYASKIVGEYGKRTAHSSWILALAEGGWIGFFLFSAFYGIGAIWHGIKLIPDDPTWLYGAVGYGTAISFLSHTYLLFPYMFVAAVTAAFTLREKP